MNAYPDGAQPNSLIQASDGNLYGTTSNYYYSSSGGVFQDTIYGDFTSLQSFYGANGYNPTGGLVQGNDGHLYGAAQSGGAYGLGTIFKFGYQPGLFLLQPSSVQANTSGALTLDGIGFAPGDIANWNGHSLATFFISDNELVALVPTSLNVPIKAYPGSATISVTHLSGYSDSANLAITAPTPIITGVSPDSLPVNSPATTITVAGIGFAPGAVVNWNNTALATTFVSVSTLHAVIPAADLTSLASVQVTVTNPSPNWYYGLTSNAVKFKVVSGSHQGTLSLTLNPNTSFGGAVNPTGTITLSAPAPSGDATVSLTSSNANAASVPATLTIPAGSTTGTFNVTTYIVHQTVSVTIKATYNNSSTASLVVYRLTLKANGLTLNPTSVTGGNNSTGTVTLNAAPSISTGPVTVSLTSSNSKVASVPATVQVPVGSTSAMFTITTHTVTQTKSPTITASFNGNKLNVILTVTP